MSHQDTVFTRGRRVALAPLPGVRRSYYDTSWQAMPISAKANQLRIHY
jgi:hypothetical protein